MVPINYKSDFKLTESSETIVSNVPFTFTYYVTKKKKYIASFDGVSEYVNCERLKDGSIEVLFNKSNLGKGTLRVERKYCITDEDFKDGIFNVVTDEATDVFLHDGKTYDPNVRTTVVPPYIKGDKGDPMTWNTMTDEERTELVQSVAEAIDPEMVMTENEQIRQSNEQVREANERTREASELLRDEAFQGLKGEMQSAITAGNTAAGNAQKVVDEYDTKVAEQDSKLSQLGSEVGVLNLYDSSFVKNDYIIVAGTSYTEIQSRYYAITDFMPYDASREWEYSGCTTGNYSDKGCIAFFAENNESSYLGARQIPPTNNYKNLGGEFPDAKYVKFSLRAIGESDITNFKYCGKSPHYNLTKKIKSENTNSATDAASTKLVWENFITEKINNNRNIFSSWDSLEQVNLEFFVLSMKIESKNNNTDERKEYYYNNLRLTEVQVTHNQVGFFIKNPKDEWVLYNSYITKESGVKRYVLTFSYYSVELILNWDYAPQTGIYGDGVQIPFEGKYLVNYDKPLSYLLYSELEDTTPTTTSLDNIFFKVFNFQDEKVVDVISEKGNFAVSYDNGLRFVAEGYTGNYEANTPQLERIAKFLTHGHKYALFYDVEFTDNILFHTSDAFEVLFIKYAQLLSFNINSEYTYVSKNRVFGVSFSQAPQDPNVEVNNYFIRFKKYNNTNTTSKILDVKFNQLMLVDVSDSILKDKTERELRALFMQTGTFEKIVLVNNTTDTRFNSLYQGLNLRSLGDSLPETVSFQPYIAQSFGMKYDSNVELTTENIVWNGENVTRWRSVYGGTRVAPITISNGDTGKAESSIYMRAKSLKYNAPDVLLILGGYNDTIAGKPYINGGTSVQPDDYGLTDEPYLGGEIDLVTNPQAEVPSFGACYRGMIENILKDVPWCRIVLCGVPRGSGETGKYGTDLDWNNKKNAVIERIAKEYGFPYVNLADVYGVNKYNYDWLTKDELHFSEFGGRRVAMEIIAKAF